jgi:hypothetical protein
MPLMPAEHILSRTAQASAAPSWFSVPCMHTCVCANTEVPHNREHYSATASNTGLHGITTTACRLNLCGTQPVYVGTPGSLPLPCCTRASLTLPSSSRHIRLWGLRSRIRSLQNQTSQPSTRAAKERR